MKRIELASAIEEEYPRLAVSFRFRIAELPDKAALAATLRFFDIFACGCAVDGKNPRKIRSIGRTLP